MDLFLFRDPGRFGSWFCRGFFVADPGSFLFLGRAAIGPAFLFLPFLLHAEKFGNHFQRIVHHADEFIDLQEPFHADEMLGHDFSKRGEFQKTAGFSDKFMFEKFLDRIISHTDHTVSNRDNVGLAAAAGYGISCKLFGCFLDVVDWRYLFHISFEKLDGDLLLGQLRFTRIRDPGLGENNNTSKIMEIRTPGTAHHLVELLNGEPVNSHRESVEYDLTGRKIHTGSQCRGRYNTGEFSFLELPFDDPAFLGSKSGVIGCSHPSDCIGDRMAPAPGIRENDRLTFVPLGRGLVELLEHQLFDERDLPVFFRKNQMAFQSHRTVGIRN